ncbi:Nn.00g118070.m01.CDS01 [Neocucurbitaria sp. VM-36]
MHSIAVLRLSSQGWKPGVEQLDECLRADSDSKLQYMFIYHDIYSKGQQLTSELSQHFQIPQHLFSDVYRRSNGFFASKDSLDGDGSLRSYHLWFRILVKTMSSDSSSSYKWHEMTFCSRWESEQSSILCIGADSSFQNILEEALLRMWPELPHLDPFSLLVPLIEAVIAMYDHSIWSVRDVIRAVEKDRSRQIRQFGDFVMLHETARHAIHSFETLSVSVETLRVLKQRALDLSVGKGQRAGHPNETSHQISMYLDSQIHMLHNLLLRSQSNKERLQNEIALGYNMIAQRDSQVMTSIGEAARQDSGAMRTIAVLSMAFLPPTFLSAIFSMSFFDYTPGQGSESAEWSVSGKFWIYWAFAIPLTCMTLGIWFFWQKRPRSR